MPPGNKTVIRVASDGPRERCLGVRGIELGRVVGGCPMPEPTEPHLSRRQESIDDQEVGRVNEDHPAPMGRRCRLEHLDRPLRPRNLLAAREAAGMRPIARVHRQHELPRVRLILHHQHVVLLGRQEELPPVGIAIAVGPITGVNEHGLGITINHHFAVVGVRMRIERNQAGPRSPAASAYSSAPGPRHLLAKRCGRRRGPRTLAPRPAAGPRLDAGQFVQHGIAEEQGRWLGAAALAAWRNNRRSSGPLSPIQAAACSEGTAILSASSQESSMHGAVHTALPALSRRVGMIVSVWPRRNLASG